jgi:hypothetical protein
MEVHAHTHTSRKKWTHYLWEFLMLFLAVFCGFLAENLREHQLENNRAKGLVVSLLYDLRNDTTQINQLQAIRKHRELQLDSFYSLLQTPPEKIDRSSFYRFLREAFRYLSFSQSTGTISQLKNAGYLRYFSDNDLIRYISNYEFWVQDYKSDEAIELKWINEILINFAAFNLDDSIQEKIYVENKFPEGIGVSFYTPDGLHNLKAIVSQLRADNYIMMANQNTRLKSEAEKLMNYLHKKYHLK